MISIFLTWIIILIYSIVIGYAFMHILSLDKYKILRTVEAYILFGLVVTTVFAQVYSLFGGLDGIAFLGITVLFLVSCTYIYFMIRKSKNCHDEVNCMHINNVTEKIKGVEKIRWVTFIGALLGVLLWTNLSPQHYDTYLYHAQAIHWAEEYGVVPGLGNLHFRLAYNSAFMPLQALFSFKWMFGQSLHTINGLVTVLMMAYSIFTIKKHDKLQCSDFMKIGIMLYFAYDCFHVSSPNTDTFALTLVFYICTKWVEFAEYNIKDYEPYAFLSILAVYATSLKLSAGIVVLICLYPALIMIKEKKWLQIIKHILIGAIILVPLLIRGYYISGYPLYPYDILSIGNPDWKMNMATLLSDRGEIVSWARGNYDTSRNSEPIWKWIGEWYSGISTLWKIVSVIALLSVVYLIAYYVKNRKKRESIAFSWITICSVVFVCFWMLSAPLPRYGIMYMIILICIAASKIFNDAIAIAKILLPMYMLVIFAYVVSYWGYIYITDNNMPNLLMQADYNNRESKTVLFETYEIAVPIDSDQTGYEPFPSTVGEGILNNIRLRGESLADGFRTQDREID